LIELYGIYGPSDETVAGAIALLQISRQGDAMVIETMDGLS